MLMFYRNRGLPMIEDNIRQKIEDLIARSRTILISPPNMERSARCIAWTTEALNIVALAIPDTKNPYRVTIENSSGVDFARRVVTTAEILRALLPDIDAGLIGNLGNKIRAATFDDFLDHAEAYRKENRKMEAGVIAGVVFEDTVRRVYRDKIADDKGQSLKT